MAGATFRYYKRFFEEVSMSGARDGNKDGEPLEFTI